MKSIFLGFFSLFFVYQSYASAPLCLDLFSKYQIVQGKEVWKKTPTEFSYEDTSYKFIFAAQLYKDDHSLLIVAELVNSKKLMRSARHGTELYAQMMSHFGAHNIQMIQDIWADGTNFKEFYSNIQKGKSLEDAARNTWSGRQAARYGFTKVRSVEFIKHEPSEYGDIPYSNRRLTVEVHFVRAPKAQ